MPVPSPADLLRVVDRLAGAYADLTDETFDEALETLSRARQPFEDRGRGRWLVTRFADARQVLQDLKLTNDLERARPASRSQGLARRLAPSGRSMLFMGNPAHDRFREVLTPYFTSGASARVVSGSAAEVRSAFDRAAASPSPSLGRDVVHPLCLRATLAMLSLPGPSSDKTMIDDLFRANTLFNLEAEPVALAAARAASRRTHRFLDEVLPSSALGARLRSAGITRADASATVEFMLRSGVVTTGSVILRALHDLSVGDERSLPDLLVRLSPTTDTGRVTTSALTVGDVTIPAGETVMVLLAAAHRDWRRSRRSAGGHLVFGAGSHRCIGARLVHSLLSLCLDLGAEHRSLLTRDWHAVPHRTPTFRGVREVIAR